MGNTPRFVPALALAILSAASSAGCVAVHRGALVQMNLNALSPSAPGTHYALFAVVNEGLAPIERFKVLSSIDDCGGSAELTVRLNLVYRYDEGVGLDGRCAPDRRLGAIDKVDAATGTLVGGIRVDTDVDLREAEAMLITLERDGDANPQPERVLMRAELADEVPPYRAIELACRVSFCDQADPEAPITAQLCGPNLPTPPPPQRGTRRGVFIQQPQTDICLVAEGGEITIVPAEDDTFL